MDVESWSPIINNILNTIQVVFLGYLAAKYQPPRYGPTDSPPIYRPPPPRDPL